MTKVWCQKLDHFPKGKNVTSCDPRKKKIATAFKGATGCTMVTLLKETPNGRFQARCFRKMQEWEGEGNYEIDFTVPMPNTDEACGLPPAPTDGTEGQDRKSYDDAQDRKSYSESAALIPTTICDCTHSGFTVRQTLDTASVRNLLCCAFEGGSNYWYMIEKVICPEGHEKDYVGDIPTLEGGALIISCKAGDEIGGKKEWHLDRATLQRGLDIMAEKYPRHFGDLMAENEDAETGDVFLQSCLFGEIIFG